jgi:hypothetical protein
LLATPFQFGNQGAYGNIPGASHYSGALAHLRIWTNRALQSQEIAALYAEPWRPFMRPRVRGMAPVAVSATQMQATQLALEEWGQAVPPPMWATQMAIEQWVSTNVTNPQMIATQLSIEQWASVATVSSATAMARGMILA